MNIFSTDAYREEFGNIRLEKWPEGLVLWVGREIRWRSFSKSDLTVTVKIDATGAIEQVKQAQIALSEAEDSESAEILHSIRRGARRSNHRFKI